ALQPEFTMRALSDMADLARAKGLRLEINGEFAGPGLRQWLDTLGADHLAVAGRPPTITPAYVPLRGIAPSPPLAFEFNDEAVAWGQRMWPRPEGADVANLAANPSRVGLSQTEFDALNSYAGGHYGYLNGKLRGSDTWQADALDMAGWETPGEVDEWISAIDAAMARTPVPEPVVVWRGIDSAGLNGLTPEQAIGKTFNEKGYMSTSAGPMPDLDQTFSGVDYDMHLRLTVPDGTPAYYTRNISAFPDENELLLGHGLDFKVTGATKVDDEWIIDATIVPKAPALRGISPEPPQLRVPWDRPYSAPPPVPALTGEEALADAAKRIDVSDVVPMDASRHGFTFDSLIGDIPGPAPLTGAPNSVVLYDIPNQRWPRSVAIIYGDDGAARAAASLSHDLYDTPQLAGIGGVAVVPGMERQGWATRLYDSLIDEHHIDVVSGIGGAGEFTPEGKAFALRYLEHRRASTPLRGIAPEPGPLSEVAGLPAVPADMSLLPEAQFETMTRDLNYGVSSKAVRQDPVSGDEFLIKFDNPQSEVAAGALADAMGLRTQRAVIRTIDGNEAAVLPVVKPASSMADMPGATMREDIANLTPEQSAELARQSVLDYLIGNRDTHSGNWLIDDQGRMWGIDRNSWDANTLTYGNNDVAYFFDSERMGILGGHPVFGEAVYFPTETRILDHVTPDTFRDAIARLDVISDEDLIRLMGPIMEHTTLGPTSATEQLIARRATVRDGYERLMAETVQRAGADVPDVWKAWDGSFAAPLRGVSPAPPVRDLSAAAMPTYTDPHALSFVDVDAAAEDIERLSRTTDNWYNSLLPAEQEALLIRKTDATVSADLNSWLRAASPDADMPSEVSLLDSVVASAHLPEPKVLYRGVQREGLDVPSVGDVITDPGYVSTSTDPMAAVVYAAGEPSQPPGIVYRYAIPQDYPAAVVGDHMGAYEWEREVLLGRDTPMQVTAVHPNVVIEGESRAVTVVDVSPAALVPAAPATPRVAPELASRDDFYRAGNMDYKMRSADQAKAFDALPDDTYVWVFHATDRENADRLMAEGLRQSNLPENLARQRYAAGEDAVFAPGAGVGAGTYVAGTAYSVEGYGRHIIGFRVKKSDLVVPPEAGTATLGDAMAHGDIGGLLVQDVEPSAMVRLVDTGRVPGDSYDELAAAMSAQPALRGVAPEMPIDRALANLDMAPSVPGGFEPDWASEKGSFAVRSAPETAPPGTVHVDRIDYPGAGPSLSVVIYGPDGKPAGVFSGLLSGTRAKPQKGAVGAF
ncbi:MAG: hypothetical protein EHM90_02310, partial [Chloroflexi bacterium]